MRLTVLASGSSGNGYLLEGRNSALLLECGVRPEVLFRMSDIRPGKIAGCLVSHEHGDHAGFADAYANLGLQVWMSEGTAEKLPKMAGRVSILKAMHSKVIGDFIVRPFDVRHDAAEPLGFIIEHEECGKILFVTDTRIVPYSFKQYRVDHIMVEANYSDAILDERVGAGEMDIERAARVRGTHMSLLSAIEMVERNETERLKNVILIHMSGQNSDPERFVKEMRDNVLFASVRAAKPGLTMELKYNEL